MGLPVRSIAIMRAPMTLKTRVVLLITQSREFKSCPATK
jgi:hypothetical protein